MMIVCNLRVGVWLWLDFMAFDRTTHPERGLFGPGGYMDYDKISLAIGCLEWSMEGVFIF